MVEMEVAAAGHRDRGLLWIDAWIETVTAHARLQIVSGHRGGVAAVDVESAAEQLVLTGAVDKTICLYDLRKFSEV
jgi:hypothetical protein